ncbi:TPA: hypothetical protein ACIRVE_005367 [Pseudomonas putida]
MTMHAVLNQALEALRLAAECGGELDLHIYADAKEKLEELMASLRIPQVTAVTTEG